MIWITKPDPETLEILNFWEDFSSFLCLNYRVKKNIKRKEREMSKIHSVFTFIALALLAFSLSAQEVDVTGDWELTMETRRGEMTRDINFVQEGENLTVTMEGRGGGEVTGEGTIKGNNIEWTITRSTPRGEMTMTYTGKVDGDTMSGEVQMGDFGSSEWNAKKK